MIIDNKCMLLIHPDAGEDGTYQNITAKEAGWDALNFWSKKFEAGRYLGSQHW